MKENKLDIIANSVYEKQSVMNKEEFILFQKLQQYLNEHYAHQFRLFIQTGLGSFIRVTKGDAYKVIGYMRADFLITNRFGIAVAVIEYQGGRHYQHKNTAERDAIKKEVCRRNQIEYIEFKPNYGELEFQLLAKTLDAYFNQERQC
ncbi:DUF2726 domain-containing protein [Rodentibacter abscessus]